MDRPYLKSEKNTRAHTHSICGLSRTSLGAKVNPNTADKANEKESGIQPSTMEEAKRRTLYVFLNRKRKCPLRLKCCEVFYGMIHPIWYKSIEITELYQSIKVIDVVVVIVGEFAVRPHYLVVIKTHHKHQFFICCLFFLRLLFIFFAFRRILCTTNRVRCLDVLNLIHDM